MCDFFGFGDECLADCSLTVPKALVEPMAPATEEIGTQVELPVATPVVEEVQQQEIAIQTEEPLTQAASEEIVYEPAIFEELTPVEEATAPVEEVTQTEVEMIAAQQVAVESIPEVRKNIG